MPSPASAPPPRRRPRPARRDRGGFDAKTFARRVIEPTLVHLEAESRTAGRLLLGTALHESGGLEHVRQINGPALGYFQMEPATHDDLWRNWLRFRSELAERIDGLRRRRGPPDAEEMAINPAYACAMARAHYLRRPEPLPGFGDVPGQARYWKAHYNTHLGKGTPAKYLVDWRVHRGGRVPFPPPRPR